jgi:hypothetical protein
VRTHKTAANISAVRRVMSLGSDGEVLALVREVFAMPRR